MLILEIAAGIVLGVLVLAYWRYALVILGTIVGFALLIDFLAGTAAHPGPSVGDLLGLAVILIVGRVCCGNWRAKQRQEEFDPEQFSDHKDLLTRISEL